MSIVSKYKDLSDLITLHKENTVFKQQRVGEWR